MSPGNPSIFFHGALCHSFVWLHTTLCGGCTVVYSSTFLGVGIWIVSSYKECCSELRNFHGPDYSSQGNHILTQFCYRRPNSPPLGLYSFAFSPAAPERSCFLAFPPTECVILLNFCQPDRWGMKSQCHFNVHLFYEWDWKYFPVCWPFFYLCEVASCVFCLFFFLSL